MTECSVDGCHRPVHARGWCSLHYGRWRRLGNPLWRTPRGTADLDSISGDRPPMVADPHWADAWNLYRSGRGPRPDSGLRFDGSSPEALRLLAQQREYYEAARVLDSSQRAEREVFEAAARAVEQGEAVVNIEPFPHVFWFTGPNLYETIPV